MSQSELDALDAEILRSISLSPLQNGFDIKTLINLDKFYAKIGKSKPDELSNIKWYDVNTEVKTRSISRIEGLGTILNRKTSAPVQYHMDKYVKAASDYKRFEELVNSAGIKLPQDEAEFMELLKHLSIELDSHVDMANVFRITNNRLISNYPIFKITSDSNNKVVFERFSSVDEINEFANSRQSGEYIYPSVVFDETTGDYVDIIDDNGDLDEELYNAMVSRITFDQDVDPNVFPSATSEKASVLGYDDGNGFQEIVVDGNPVRFTPQHLSVPNVDILDNAGNPKNAEIKLNIAIMDDDFRVSDVETAISSSGTNHFDDYHIQLIKKDRFRDVISDNIEKLGENKYEFPITFQNSQGLEKGKLVVEAGSEDEAFAKILEIFDESYYSSDGNSLIYNDFIYMHTGNADQLTVSKAINAFSSRNNRLLAITESIFVFAGEDIPENEFTAIVKVINRNLEDLRVGPENKGGLSKFFDDAEIEDPQHSPEILDEIKRIFSDLDTSDLSFSDVLKKSEILDTEKKIKELEGIMETMLGGGKRNVDEWGTKLSTNDGLIQKVKQFKTSSGNSVEIDPNAEYYKFNPYTPHSISGSGMQPSELHHNTEIYLNPEGNQLLYFEEIDGQKIVYEHQLFDDEGLPNPDFIVQDRPPKSIFSDQNLKKSCKNALSLSSDCSNSQLVKYWYHLNHPGKIIGQNLKRPGYSGTPMYYYFSLPGLIHKYKKYISYLSDTNSLISDLDNNLISIADKNNHMLRAAVYRNLELLSYQNKLFTDRLIELSKHAEFNGKGISGVIELNSKKIRFNNKEDLVIKIYLLTIADLANDSNNIAEYLIAYKHIGSLYSLSFELKSSGPNLFRDSITEHPFTSGGGIFGDFINQKSSINEISPSRLWDPNTRPLIARSMVTNNEIIFSKLQSIAGFNEFIYSKPIVENNLPPGIRDGLEIIVRAFDKDHALTSSLPITANNVKFILSRLNENINDFLDDFLSNPGNSGLLDGFIEYSDDLSKTFTRQRFILNLYRTNKWLLDFNTHYADNITFIDFRSVYLAIRVFIASYIT